MYTRAQCLSLIRYAKTHDKGVYIILLLCTGLRCGELCALQWEDIDLENRVIHINKAISRENNKPVVDVPKTETSIRDLPISRSLEKYLKQFEGRSGYLV